MALLLLMFFIYAVLGVFLFKDIIQGDAIEPEIFNFKTFGNAMTTLFRCSTGEDWFKIMFDTMKTSEDGCIEKVNCGSRIFINYYPLIHFKK